MRHVARLAISLLAISATGIASAEAAPGDATARDTPSVRIPLLAEPPILALGDSIAFGYDPTVSQPAITESFVGYPHVVAQTIGAPVVNAACPGETSRSFLVGDAPDVGCKLWRSKYTNHTAYVGTQAAFAYAYIAQHPETKYVTFNLGANDLFLVARNCSNEPVCVARELPAAVVEYGKNLATIFDGLEAAGFRGKVIAMKTYALNYLEPVGVAAITVVNGILAHLAARNGYFVADGFDAFGRGATRSLGDACAAGLLIKMPDGTCDIHPSAAGRDLLGATVAATLRAADLASPLPGP